MSTLTTIPSRLLAFLLVAAVAGAVLVTRDGEEAGADQVVGLFHDASPLEAGSEVRAAGVKVGEVQDIELDGDHARVTLDVDDSVLPVHSDARMVIKPINLLGENFVELVPGDEAKPALSGEVPLERTSNAVTLQGLLDTFDDPTAAGLAALVSELGNGVDGSGAELGHAIKALGPAMTQIDRLGDVLRGQNETLSRLIATAEPVARAASGKDGQRLDALIEQGRTTLAALAAQQTGLQSTIEQLPATLQEARRALSSLDRVANAVTPTLRKARPVTRDLEAISEEIVGFSKYATPAFASFDGVFREADRLLGQAAPVVAALRRSGNDLRASAASVRVAGDLVVRDHLGDLMAFVRKWALSTNGRDNVSHYFRGVFHVTPAALNALLGKDVVPEVLSPGGDGTGSSDPLDLLPDLPGLDLGGTLGGVTGGLLGGRDPGSATGLTSNQEQSLLGQLLGGQR